MKVTRRLALQSWLPFLIAFAYAAWDYQSSPPQSQTMASLIKSLGVSFFLIMWFVGQWFRASKQITDEEQLSSIKADVAAIKDAVTRSSPAQPPVVTPPASSDPISSTLYSEAQAAMDAGLSHSALLSAGVAIEHSLRQFAEARNVADSSRLPIPKILGHLRQVINQAVLDELASLWKVRNTVAHMRDEQVFDRQKAANLLDNFGWAIRFLSNHP